MVVEDRVRGVLSQQEHVEAGDTRVEAVRVRLGEDANGDEALFFTLILAELARKRETWPGEDIWELRRMTRDIFAKTGLDIPLVISFATKRTAGQADEAIGEVDIEL